MEVQHVGASHESVLGRVILAVTAAGFGVLTIVFGFSAVTDRGLVGGQGQRGWTAFLALYWGAGMLASLTALAAARNRRVLMPALGVVAGASLATALLTVFDGIGIPFLVPAIWGISRVGAARDRRTAAPVSLVITVLAMALGLWFLYIRVVN